jgi:4-amino-4-deoxy-L-arabinose transferase-like glycosyltransferase
MTSRPAPTGSRFFKLALVLIFAAGVALRVCDFVPFKPSGTDEFLYAAYARFLAEHGGVTAYPKAVESYLVEQSRIPGALLPPTRFVYIFCGYLWHSLFGKDPHSLPEIAHSLRGVSCVFNILALALAGAFAWRLRGRAAALAVLALMACAPTQIYMAKHALIDGVFAFWAIATLWALWENLRRPGHPGWLAAYMLLLAILVMTKENSFFAYIGFLAVLVSSRWAGFGAVSPRLLLCTVAGPLLGVALLVLLAGGLDHLIGVYSLLVREAYKLDYAIKTGDGPWHRYLFDMTLVSPVVTLLAIGACFHPDTRDKPNLLLIVFLVSTYVVMCNVKYGMNLRYANMWDMPTRVLAFSLLAALADKFHRHKALLLGLAVAAVCLVDLYQYYVFFIRANLYELIPEDLLRAVRMLPK